MKSYLAITLLAALLGGGYWKYNNPSAGLDSLSSQAKGQAAGITSLFGGPSNAQMADLSSELETSRAQLQITQEQLQQNRNSLDSTSARLATTEKRLNELLSIMDEQQKILTEQQAVNLEHASRFSDVDTSITAIRGSISGFDTNSSTEDSTLQPRLAAIESQLDDLSAKNTTGTANVTDELNALSVRVTQERSDAMVQLSDALRREQQSRLNALKDEIAKTRQTELVAATEALRDEQQAIQVSNERSITQSISGLQNQFSTLSAITGDSQSALALSASLDERIASLENDVASLDQTDALQRLQDQLATNIKEVRSELVTATPGAAPEVLAQLQENLDLAQQKIAALENQSANINDTSLAERIVVIESRLDEHNQQDVIGRIAALETSISESSNQLASLDDAVQTISENSQPQLGAAATENDLQQRIDSLKQGVIQENTSNYEQLRVAINQQRVRLDDMNKQLVELNQASEDGNTRELKSQIAVLSQRLDGMAGQSGDNTQQLVSKLDQVSQKVEELEQSEFLTPADLAAAEASKGDAIEYTIYFDRDSANISDDATKVLQSFLTQEKNRADSVAIYGFTDSSGNAQYNQRLALRRANQVRSWLIQQGFDFRKINEVDGLGEDVSKAVRAGQAELANQRAVVLYSFQN